MPVSLLNADTMFPSFTEGTSSSEKIDVVMNYLYMLLEELRYTFGNLGTENFNDASLNELSIKLTKPVYGKIEDVEGNINELKITSTGLSSKISSVDGRVTSLAATVDGIEMDVVGLDGELSELSLTVDGIEMDVVGLDGEVSGLSLTVDGFSTRISNVDGRVTSLAATVDEIEMDVVGLDGELSELSLTVDGFSTRISNAEGSVTAITQTVKSIRLEAFEDSSGNTAAIQINGDGIDASAVAIKFKGLVTFEDLAGDGTTTINGANVNTGTIKAITIDSCKVKASTFTSVLNGSGTVSGEMKFYYLADYAEFLAGGIKLDSDGAGTDEDAQYRMFLYTNYVAGSGVAFSLKLKSADKISIEAADFLYLYGDNITINANQGRGTIHLFGDVYINGNLIS